MPVTFDVQLRSYATVKQLEYMDASEKHGSCSKAAKALGIHKSTITNAIVAAKKKAAKHGYSPEHNLIHPVAPGQMLRGASQLYRRGEPEPLLTWVKSSADQAAQEEIMRAAVAAMCEDITPLSPQTQGALIADKSLCNVFTLTDSHVGAMCWGKETGEDWNLQIAEDVLTGCFQKMVNASPSAGTAVVAQLGDFLHQDGMKAVTPLHGHLLDADSRFTKIVQVAVRILRRVIGMALEKHEKVIVLLAEGNHDMTSSIWLRTMFAALYELEPRVEVIDSALPYYVYAHGETMLSWHHGHLKKSSELPMLFAAKFPVIWGKTKKRYCHTGHRHHVEEKEYSGMKVIQHSTITAPDSHSVRNGYVSEREVTAFTYHTEFGQHSRVTIVPEMLG